jgi:hypothetical protein
MCNTLIPMIATPRGLCYLALKPCFGFQGGPLLARLPLAPTYLVLGQDTQTVLTLIMHTAWAVLLLQQHILFVEDQWQVEMDWSDLQ